MGFVGDECDIRCPGGFLAHAQIMGFAQRRVYVYATLDGGMLPATWSAQVQHFGIDPGFGMISPTEQGPVVSRGFFWGGEYFWDFGDFGDFWDFCPFGGNGAVYLGVL